MREAVSRWRFELALTLIAGAVLVGAGVSDAGSEPVERGGPGVGCAPTVAGTEFQDVLLGDNGGSGVAVADRIDAGGRHDTVHGFKGNDCLYGGDGADWLGGYDGDDIVSGQRAADTLYGGDGADKLLGDLKGKPIPQKKLPMNVDLLDGGPGKDVLVGGYGPDELYGGAGYDICIGGPDGDGPDEPLGPKTDWKDKYYGCEETRE